MKKTLKLIARILARITSTLIMLPTLAWTYAAIILAILSPMLIMIPTMYISWEFISFLNIRDLGDSWLTFGRPPYPPSTIVLLVFEFLIFTIGLVLFFWGLFSLATTIFKKEGLAKRGPYNFIRHPQHLGIILMSFSVSLLVPWTRDQGIRVGEIVSWSLFSFILIIWSEYEEWRLERKFGEEYIQYRSKTGAFFPKIFNRNNERKGFYDLNRWLRYFIVFVSYIIFLVIVYLLAYWLRRVGILAQLY
ncbi:MAG: methyltransferase family protein [Candidatus Heimdallarchaeaceae archaeon]